MARVNVPRLQEDLAKIAAKSPRNFLEDQEKTRKEFIKTAFDTGGKSFLERVRKFGLTEKGKPLILRSHYCEYLQTLGDLRLGWVLTTGPAQVGKTIGHTLLMVDVVATGKLNGAWFYDARSSLDQYVPMQFQPAARTWIALMEKSGHRFRRAGDRQTNTNYQIGGANAIFSFVSTSKTSRLDSGGAAAAAAASSFPASIAIMEERSQYEPGAADVCLDRLANSEIPTQPRRDLGTSGGGMGIEADMADCNFYFYPHYDCRCCGKNLPLDPKGCVLKKVERVDLLGKSMMTHLSETGRPIKWWHHDPEDIQQSAYIACSNCGSEIEDIDRLENTRYRCTQTGIFLRDFLDSLPAGIPDRALKIGLHMSPLTREGIGRTIAINIVSRGLSTSNPANWQQQVLGHYSTTNRLKLNQMMLRDRIGAEVPNIPRDYRLAGVDIGRQEDWLIIFDYYLPPNHQEMSVAQIAEQTVKKLVYSEAVNRDDIPDILKEWEVDYGLVDNEPSIEAVMGLCQDTVLQMANQLGRAKHTIKCDEVTDGGIKYPCWALRNSKFMLQVFEGFITKAWDGDLVYRLPSTWEKWLTDSSERSPIVHLCGPWRDTNNKWNRGKNNLDDFYMAFLFAEAALYLKLTEDKEGAETMVIGSYII